VYASLLRQISAQLHFHEAQHLFRDRETAAGGLNIGKERKMGE
jgi:hypothetical protein